MRDICVGIVKINHVYIQLCAHDEEKKMYLLVLIRGYIITWWTIFNALMYLMITIVLNLFTAKKKERIIHIWKPNCTAYLPSYDVFMYAVTIKYECVTPKSRHRKNKHVKSIDWIYCCPFEMLNHRFNLIWQLWQNVVDLCAKIEERE